MERVRRVRDRGESIIEGIIFGSRWLQAPLYFGLIIAQCFYTYKCLAELFHTLSQATVLTEIEYLLSVLNIIDIIMVANLIAMVTIGGYATFVSKLNLDDHKDKPDWLSHIDPGTIKVKLAASLIGISSIHLLQAFINIENMNSEQVKWQVIIHFTFVFSTVFLALSEYIMARKH